MKELHPKLKVGTSSWSNAEWPLYPPGMKPGEFIGHYSRHFPIVEVDSSFYHAPAPSLCSRWYLATPETFTFALKVPQAITHEKVLVSAEKEWAGFLESVSCLKEKLGFLVLQFAYFNKSSACPTLGDFMKRLGPFLATAQAPCPLVVEVRNKTWIGKDLLDCLAERKAILALTDQEWMPKPKALWEKHGTALLTGPASYIRLLGERKRIDALTKTWDKLVIDRAPETKDVITVIRQLLEKTTVATLVNNHFGGYAVASIELLEQLWAETP